VSLLTLLDDILDLCKAESGKLVVEREDFDLQRSLELSFDRARARAQERSLDLALEVSVEPGLVRGDPVRLEQLLRTLIDNALHLTDEGHIDVRVWRPEGSSSISFEVRDTGIGMSPEQLRDALAPRGADDGRASTLHFGCAGIGTALARALAAELGGALVVKNSLGVGTTARFDLPLPPSKGLPDAAMSSSLPPSSSLRPGPRTADVLLVAAAGVQRKIPRFLLRSRGHSVTCADGPEQAMAAALGASFDLILIDGQCPGTNALRLAHELRCACDPRPHVVAMTVRASSDDREHCLEAGMHDCLSKPLDPGELERAVQRALRSTSPRPEGAWRRCVGAAMPPHKG
jgi:CheY-like chemotaxis protein